MRPSNLSPGIRQPAITLYLQPATEARWLSVLVVEALHVVVRIDRVPGASEEGVIAYAGEKPLDVMHTCYINV